MAPDRLVLNAVFHILSVLAAVSDPTILHADDVDECLARKQKDYENPQAFEKRGEITCGSAELVGFPPRVRTHNETGSVSYNPPTGFVIRNQSVLSIQIENVSQNDGSYGSPSVAPDGSGVTVPIACSGKGPGAGRSWQHIVLRGTIVRVATTELIKKWAVECVKCVARQDCPGQ